MKKRIRIPDSTINKLSQIRKITNPYQAICEFVDLVENFFLTERGLPAKYDEKTGKPKTWEWKPYERYQQKKGGFLFNDGARADVRETGEEIGTHAKYIEVINSRVIKYFDKNLSFLPLLVKINSKPYVIYQDSIGWSYYEGDYGNTKSGIVVMPLKPELKLEGLVRSDVLV